MLPMYFHQTLLAFHDVLNEIMVLMTRFHTVMLPIEVKMDNHTLYDSTASTTI